jgi:hypothetical protein
MSDEQPMTPERLKGPLSPDERAEKAEQAAIAGATEAPPFIAMLAVPRSWTRLLVAVVVLLGMVVALVSFMVYINWRNTQANTDRIIELQRRLGALEGEQER